MGSSITFLSQRKKVITKIFQSENKEMSEAASEVFTKIRKSNHESKPLKFNSSNCYIPMQLKCYKSHMFYKTK